MQHEALSLAAWNLRKGPSIHLAKDCPNHVTEPYCTKCYGTNVRLGARSQMLNQALLQSNLANCQQ